MAKSTSLLLVAATMPGLALSLAAPASPPAPALPNFMVSELSNRMVDRRAAPRNCKMLQHLLF